jgi:hypothetical protein
LLGAEKLCLHWTQSTESTGITNVGKTHGSVVWDCPEPVTSSTLLISHVLCPFGHLLGSSATEGLRAPLPDSFAARIPNVSHIPQLRFSCQWETSGQRGAGRHLVAAPDHFLPVAKPRLSCGCGAMFEMGQWQICHDSCGRVKSGELPEPGCVCLSCWWSVLWGFKGLKVSPAAPPTSSAVEVTQQSD